MTIISRNNSIINNSGTIINGVQNRIVPTFIIIGDSNADGRAGLVNRGNKYFPEIIANNINNDKYGVKIFDQKLTNRFIALNKKNAQVNNNSTFTNFGFEQTIGLGLSKHYTNEEIRIIKYGFGSTTAGGTGIFSWQPGETHMLAFETVYNNAILAAESENIILDLICCISFLGTNDAVNLTLSNNYEANMTNVIEHLRDNVFLEQIPFIITSCTDDTTYKTTVRAAQQSLCTNVPNCTYFNLHRFGNGSVHPANAGVYTGGLEIARTIITSILSGVDYLEDYIFSFQTNASGSYSIAMIINESIYNDFYIDWGDGNTSEINARSGTYSRTYADTSVKTIKIKLMCPWNIFSLTINSGGSKIYGTLNMKLLTGLDTFVTSANNTDFNSIVYPDANYNYLVFTAPSLFNNCKLTSIDLTRFGITINTVISNNTELVSIYDNFGIKTVGYLISDTYNNPKLESIDLENWRGSSSIYLRANVKLTTLKLPKYKLGVSTWRW